MATSKVTAAVNLQKSSSDLDGDAGAYWAPNTDVYSVEDGIVIKVELAGIARENLHLTVDENRLKINGSRPDGCRSAKCVFLVMEINYGAFETVIELPPGYDLSTARASYHNGFLRVDVPRAEAMPAKSLSVKIEESSDL